jgi:hypothetical protein
MRFALLAVLVAGCAGSSHEAAWPKGHTAETDGGESLAPHEARMVATAKPVDDDKPATPAAATAVPVATATEATPDAVTPAAAAAEEVIQSEEIVIEIDD